MELSDKDLLNYAVENGIVDINTIRANIEMNERKRYLDLHTKRVWKGQDGRWATYLPDRNNPSGRKLVKKATEEELEDAIVEYYKFEANDPYIEDIFNAWIKNKIAYGEILPQTFDRYETDFHRFFDDHPISKVKFRLITEDMLEDFIKTTIHEKGLTAKGWGNLRTVINGIFKYGKKKKHTEISITRFMGDLDLSRRSFEKRYFTDEESVFTNSEIDKIKEFVYSRTPSLINYGILFAFQTGLRAGEIAALSKEDLSGKILNVSKTEVRYKDPVTREHIFEIRGFTKGSAGARKVILTDDAIKTFNRLVLLNPDSDYLFNKNGTFIRSRAFSTKLYKICEQVGIRRRSLHKARKTYGTKLLNAGVNEKLIEKQMGHTNISTTRNFYYYNNTELDEAINIISSALG